MLISSYNVSHWSSKLKELDSETDQWIYIMTLERSINQEPLAVATAHPDAEETVDWEKYLDGKEAKVKSLEDVEPKLSEVIQWLPSEEETTEPDSEIIQYKVDSELGQIRMPPHINYIG